MGFANTSVDTVTIGELRERVERIRPIIEEHALRGEIERTLPEPVYDAMLGAGLFRLLAPRAYGGYQLHPVEAYEIWEAVARIDSAAGWCLQISAAAAGLLAWIDPRGVDEVYAADGADTVVATSFFPPAAATPCDGGFKLSGRMPYASGADRATWFMVPFVEMDGDEPRIDDQSGAPKPMMSAVPRGDLEVIDTWNTLGMRGTGSNELLLDDVFVPSHRFGPVGVPEEVNPVFDAAAAVITPIQGIHGEAVVSLGVASSAIERLIDLAQTKVPAMTTTLRDRPMAQHHMAKAQALVESAREYLHAAARDAYAEASTEGAWSSQTRVRTQLAACVVAENGAEAVRLVHEAAGASGIHIGAGFERHLRDAMTLSQHNSKSYGRYEDAGKVMFGVPSEWLLFNL